MFFTIRLLGTAQLSPNRLIISGTFFNLVDDSAVRIEIMNALGATATGNQEIIYGINAWLREYNAGFKAGKSSG